MIAELKRFLALAKHATYASQGDAASVTPFLPDSKQLEYSNGDFVYRDIYVGMLRFTGQEIVYRAGRAVWSMSYSGGVVEGIAQNSVLATYAFLRQALRALPPELPLRGPSLLEETSMRYVCDCSGDLASFHGVEVITEHGARVYQLHFAGGLLA